ncbi:MAG: carbohydrate ABC transporter permease [Bacillota bacterium]|jgi:multiple sugar transport system permease protein
MNHPVFQRAAASVKKFASDWRWNRIAYLFILPALLGTIIVHITPMISSILISFKDLDIFSLQQWTKAPFIGLKNFIDGFNPITTVGQRYWRSVLNVLIYGAVTIPVGYALGLAVALLLNKKFVGRTLVRGIVLLPYILPDSVTFNVWRFMFQSRIGIVNKTLLALGIIKEPMVWLVGKYSLFAVMVASIWKGWPFGCLLLLAGLQTIPQEVIEAATIDGAGPWQRFRYVIFPYLKPVSKTLLLLNVIWNFNAFNQFYIMLGNDPGVQADVPSVLIHRETFLNFHFGLGSAMSLILVIMMMTVAAIYLRTLRVNKSMEE